MLKWVVPVLLSGLAKEGIAQSVPIPQQQEVLASMRLANAYFMNKWPDPGVQIVTNIARPSNIWTRAVYYEGLMALYSVDPKKAYFDYAVDWGTKHQWTPRNGIIDRNADDQCSGQTYIDLYSLSRQSLDLTQYQEKDTSHLIDRIAPIRACLDNMLNSDRCDDWHWIDAIQMAMPVFTRVGVVCKDTACFRKMYDLYHYTKTIQGGHGLYNPDEHLWWRDKDFVPPYKEPNGQNCYWSRGNGWVLAALVRTLSLLPQMDGHRAAYLRDYLDMVGALVAVQRPDGFWNVSLHDSTHFGGKELSGTALFTYGIAWGIRQGILDKKQYLPIVMRAWNGMVKDAMHPDGMLGYVQGTGKEPKDGQPVGYDKIPDFEDYGLGCFLLAGSEVVQLATPKTANLDEASIPPYQESSPLTLADGSTVSTAGEWEKKQRPNIYRWYENNVYGRMPGPAANPVRIVKAVDTAALGGVAIRKEVTILFLPSDTSAKLNVVLYLPRHARKPVPVFVGYNFGGNGTVESSSQWPLKEILARGYGVVTAWYWDLEADRSDGWQTGIRTKLSGALQIEPYEWSAIGAWAWGLERIADYLGTDRSVDAKKMILIGHSRLGKTALWAGASDPRFAILVSNESGEGGAALSKREYGETVGMINTKFPWWFVPAYKQYGSNTDDMAMDQHFLLSMIAPRPLYVASAVEDRNSDPKGEFLSAFRAGEVYTRIYKEPALKSDSMPSSSQPVGDFFIRYHIRPGKHDITLYDWQQYMDFADKRFAAAGHSAIKKISK